MDNARLALEIKSVRRIKRRGAIIYGFFIGVGNQEIGIFFVVFQAYLQRVKLELTTVAMYGLLPKLIPNVGRVPLTVVVPSGLVTSVGELTGTPFYQNVTVVFAKRTAGSLRLAVN